MKNLEYFLSEEFNDKKEITMEDVWALGNIIPDNQFTGKSFEDMFLLTSDDGESWLNWNGELKRIKQINEINFF